MKRFLFAGLIAVIATVAAQAHFVFIVPAATGLAATVVLSDDLNPDDAVEVSKIAGIKLFVRTAGKDAPVAPKADKHSLAVDVPGSGQRVVFGSVEYGVMQRGDAKPFLLVYHPKTILGAVPADVAAVGLPLPVELLPAVEGGAVRFNLTAGGKPVGDAEVNVLKPDGSKAKLKTGATGRTEAVTGTGRYGVWARVLETKSGEHGGKKYEETRHYPTLVVDVK